MKTWKVLILMILILASIIFLLKELNFNLSRAGHSKELRTISESKELKVFISEYYPPQNKIIIQNGDYFQINNSWIENNWKYDYWMNADISKGIYNLTIVFDSIQSNINYEYIFQWKKNERYYNAKHFDSYGILNQIKFTNKMQLISDTFKIFIANYFPKEKKYDTLTSFILVRKK